MRVAILGATSEIAKDLIIYLSEERAMSFHLFARSPEKLIKWIDNISLKGCFSIDDFFAFGKQDFDAIINFVGVGNPAEAARMGSSIFDVTLKYDELVLDYLDKNPSCRYIFLSSGAAYCSNFEEPANTNTKAQLDINNLQPQDWYGVAKLHAECRHRSLSYLPIVDLRVFNYFSHTQDMNARFFITDIVRAISDEETLTISPDDVFRDYIGPKEFYSLISLILNSKPQNEVVDLYSLAPVNKFELLDIMEKSFGLKYKVLEIGGINSTGKKPHYYSLNRKAEVFGYKPTKTSIETIVEEVGAYLGNYGFRRSRIE